MSDVPKSRWKLLAKAIISNCNEDTKQYSSKLNGPFGLVVPEPLPYLVDSIEEGYQWFQYTFQFFPQTSIVLRHVQRRFTTEELTGFDNTGNVCVWPSEEVLAHYCIANGNIFQGKRVIELGGGMTCLAGLTVAKFSRPCSICLTDGNQNCVDNVRAILDENLPSATNTDVRKLDWKDLPTFDSQVEKWDFVLCADCAFFDDGRENLVNAIWSLLVPGGVAFVMAPKRGNTLEKFVDLCQSRFQVVLSEAYDPHVTRLHEEKMQAEAGYKPDMHYPLLVTLSKL